MQSASLAENLLFHVIKSASGQVSIIDAQETAGRNEIYLTKQPVGWETAKHIYNREIEKGVNHGQPAQ